MKPAKRARTRTSGADRRGIQSISIGYSLLKALAESPRAMHLREVASSAGMASSKAHRYLASFMKTGLVVQDDGSGTYDLGPSAIQLGLAALGRLDRLAIAIGALAQATRQTDLDAHLTVWGARGPTVIRWIARPADVTIRVSEGSVMPLTRTAIGRLWAAYMPESVTKSLVESELEEEEPEDRDRARAQFRAKIAEIRSVGLSLAHEERRKGMDAIAGPIFDRNGEIVYAATLIGIHREAGLSMNSDIAAKLREILRGVSSRFGYVERDGAATHAS